MWRWQKKALKAATKEVYENINAPFEKKENIGIIFAVAQASVPELNVKLNNWKNRAKLKREKRNKSRADKKHIPEQWHHGLWHCAWNWEDLQPMATTVTFTFLWS